MNELLKQVFDFFDDPSPTKKRKRVFILVLTIIVLVISFSWGVPQIRLGEDRKRERKTRETQQQQIATIIRNKIMDSHVLHSGDKFQEAKELLDNVLEEDPENYYAYYRRGLAYVGLGDNVKEKYPRESKAYYRSGNQDADEAIKRNGRFEEENGIHQEYAPYYLKALCLFGLNRHNEAKDAIDVAIGQNSENYAYFQVRANICANLGEREEAASARMAAAELCLTLGSLAQAKYNYEKAVVNYEKAGDSSDTEEARSLFIQYANEVKAKIAELETLIKKG